MISELAPELLEIIFGLIIASSRDKVTLRACSLAFPQHTTLFQRALCSKKPLTLSFNRNTDQDLRVRKMINTLVDLLDVNPRFGACLGPDVRFHFYASPQYLSDPRAAKIARCCSMDSGIVSLTIKITGGRGSWADFSEDNRETLESIIAHSPRLRTLKLVSMGVPWSVFLRPRPFLESLVLQDGCYSIPTPPSLVPLPAALPNDVGFKPIRIGYIIASPEELRRLAEALSDTPDVDGKDAAFAVDFGHLRGLVAKCDYNGGPMELRPVLHRTDRLEVMVIILLSVVNERSTSSETRIQQLTEQKEELEGMKWDFGSLFIDVRERFAYV